MLWKDTEKDSHLRAKGAGLRGVLPSQFSEEPTLLTLGFWPSSLRTCERTDFHLQGPQVWYTDMVSLANKCRFLCAYLGTRTSFRLSLSQGWEILEEDKEQSHRFGVISSSGFLPQSTCSHFFNKHPSDTCTLHCVPLHSVGQTGRAHSVLTRTQTDRFGVWASLSLLRFMGLIWGKGSFVVPSSCQEMDTGCSLSPFLLRRLTPLQARLRAVNIFLVAF